MAKTIHMAGGTTIASLGGTVTRYIPLHGYTSQNTPEANSETLLKTAGTYSAFGVRVTSTTISSIITVKLRINTTDGNEVISIPSSSTGWFDDLTHTDTISSGDLVKTQWNFTAGETGSVSVQLTKAEFDTNTSTTNSISVLACNTPQNNTSHTGASTTYYIPINGHLNPGTTLTTEATSQQVEIFSATFKNLRIKISANSRTTTTTLRFRKNGANGNQSVAFSNANGTGWF